MSQLFAQTEALLNGKRKKVQIEFDLQGLEAELAKTVAV
jgi:hypothetical protein